MSLLAGAWPALLSARQPHGGSHETRLATSGDAYVWEARVPERTQWRFGTGVVEKRVQLDHGHLILAGLTDRATRHEYVRGPSDVLDFTWDGRRVTGRTVQWVLDGVQTGRLKHGELLLRLTLHAAGVSVVKSYLLYPKESIIQEWLQITNRSGHPAVLADPAALAMTVLHHEAPAVDFTYMTGASSDTTRWRFYTAPLVTRTFEGFGNRDYAPIQVYQNRTTHDAVFVGWDYMGAWSSAVVAGADSAVQVDFRVAHYHQPLVPGASIETPKAFTGVFHGDFDELGHQLLDYQYRYKWDYTRPSYFPGMEMEGNWFAGSSWLGGTLDIVSTYRKVFHLADVLRAVGGDIYWRDYGWWDNQGDWNGPNWAETGRYLARYDMRQIIYIPVQDADSVSKVARDHPEWLGGPAVPGGRTMDQSRPEVIDWELKLLESKHRQWGDFQWRKDFDVVTGVPDSSRMLAQDQRFRGLLRTFLDRNPGMAFHGCSSGAFDLGYDMLQFGVSWSMNDFFADRWRGYYPSYLFPPEKLENIPDKYSPENYDKATWRGLLWNRFPLIGETANPAKLEGVRELIDIDHYLLKQRVLGRWSWVYHPSVTGDSADWYLERLSGDHRRGIIVPGHAPKTPVTIYPKGLLPDATYQVSYQESPVTMTRLGLDLMAHGVSFSSVPDGEIVYLNLPLHPGSAADRTPPTPPSHVTIQAATHMDYSGVELAWQPGHDDNWVSYYEVYRNGALLGKVAKGTYYFDHALGADITARYAVVTVDGSGNKSAAVSVTGAGGRSPLVLDDTSHRLAYTGSGWQHETGQWSVANGTQAQSRTPGDAVSMTFTGSRVTWYGRLGQDKGIAAVYLDGTLDRLVNTYDADDIPNIAVYSRSFPASERHTLKIVAVGPAWISVDGVQVDQAAPRVVAARPGSGIAYRGHGWSHLPDRLGDGADDSRTERSRGGASVSAAAGDRATYTFTGRGVTWVGRRCAACGMADVYVDGRLETTVDMYVQPIQTDSLRTDSVQTEPLHTDLLHAGSLRDEQHAVPLFTRRWGRPGRHTVEIVVRPDTNMLATGHEVTLDALYVEP